MRVLKTSMSIVALASVLGGVSSAVFAQTNSTTVVTVPVGENTELSNDAGLAADGLFISIDGDPVGAAAPRTDDTTRKTDIALQKADIQVRFDGLTITPRLDVTLSEDQDVFEQGDVLTFNSATNYPAFIDRGELRLIDLDAIGGPKTVLATALAPNTATRVTLPAGNLVAVYRVYDASGRFDETRPLSLRRLDTSDIEQGFDATQKRNIQINGGAVTVSGTNVGQGADVEIMGVDVTPDPSGRFVIQRILPPGDHGIDVRISGGRAQPVDLTRDITIPRSEAFYLAVVDVTYGKRVDELSGIDDTYTTGRVSGYWNGRTANGYKIVASVDTGEGDLKDIFRDLAEKDPRNLLLRVNPNDLYPTYGDDSTLEDTTPTAGKFYLHVEKNGSYGTWGTVQADISGGAYLRNERTLYGAEINLQTQAVTANGDARARFQLYAAQPENLPGRDVFRGTGGAVYFLQRQDISVGSETLTVEVRDANTGLIVERTALEYGRDYAINYIQGLITLSEPLSGTTGGGTVISSATGDYIVNLVAQYEFTPTATDVDGFTYGGRAEAWLTDGLRFGITGQVENTDVADQESYGVDVLYRVSDGTFVELDYAKSQGQGFTSSYSTDGGFVIDETAQANGTGEAFRLNAKADFADLGLNAQGSVGGYFERRTEGFSTLDYQTLAATGDEDFWGIYIRGDVTDRLSYRLQYDDYSNAAGEFNRTGAAEIGVALSDVVTLDLGIEHTDQDTGQRTDIGARLTYAPNEDAEVYVFGQAAVDTTGLGDDDRFGVGGTYAFASGWNVTGEISDGTAGLGAKAVLGYSDDNGTSSYFGYELTPEREFTGVTLAGQDRGRFIVGGTRKVNDRLSYYGEHTYDMFGAHRSLSSAYGAAYSPDEFLTYTGALEIGRVSDDVNGDFDRQALSFGVRYQDDEQLSAQGRLEYRRDRGVLTGTVKDADTLLLTGSARYKISDQARLVFNLSASKTESDESSILDGELVDLTFGYAYRPVRDDKLNVLLKYRFLRDMYGQQIDGTDTPGARQESHVFSVDADYDVNENWTVGGKLGFRLSESAPDSTTAFSENNAYLAVINARYHLVHKWDLLFEGRALGLEQAQTTEIGALAAAYRHLGNNVKVGVGYNFGTFSDDLTDLSYDDKGAFINFVAKF